MKVKILDIPVSGKDISFDLPLEPLNARLDADRIDSAEPILQPPKYAFVAAPHVELHLQLEGLTVYAKGEVDGRYATICSRCAGEVEQAVESPIEMIIESEGNRHARGAEEGEAGVAFHDGKQIDCGPFSEDAIVAAIPFTVLCSEGCKGLCIQCGANLNQGPCGCVSIEEEKAEVGDPRMSIFRTLKIN